MREREFQLQRPIPPITPRQSRNLARITIDQIDWLVGTIDACAHPAEQLAVARFLHNLAADLLYSVAKAAPVRQ